MVPVLRPAARKRESDLVFLKRRVKISSVAKFTCISSCDFRLFISSLRKHSNWDAYSGCIHNKHRPKKKT